MNLEQLFESYNIDVLLPKELFLSFITPEIRSLDDSIVSDLEKQIMKRYKTAKDSIQDIKRITRNNGWTIWAGRYIKLIMLYEAYSDALYLIKRKKQFMETLK